uniref:NADH-ubiquinone oxidoreductase chain 4L n=1 Tax=Geukensia demissa TaxID=27807 RepID=A0A6B9VPW8_GEUDE|nr:NADH dehydrogenase subunit 4L [Geukensia demissa]
MMSFMFILFMCSFFSVLFKSKSLIGTFISIELISLSLIGLSVMVMYENCAYVLMIITLAVSEAAISLTMVVVLVRNKGNDLVMNLMSDKS